MNKSYYRFFFCLIEKNRLTQSIVLYLGRRRFVLRKGI